MRIVLGKDFIVNSEITFFSMVVVNLLLIVRHAFDEPLSSDQASINQGVNKGIYQKVYQREPVHNFFIAALKV